MWWVEGKKNRSQILCLKHFQIYLKVNIQTNGTYLDLFPLSHKPSKMNIISSLYL